MYWCELDVSVENICWNEERGDYRQRLLLKPLPCCQYVHLSALTSREIPISKIRQALRFLPSMVGDSWRWPGATRRWEGCSDQPSAWESAFHNMKMGNCTIPLFYGISYSCHHMVYLIRVIIRLCSATLLRVGRHRETSIRISFLMQCILWMYHL